MKEYFNNQSLKEIEIEQSDVERFLDIMNSLNKISIKNIKNCKDIKNDELDDFLKLLRREWEKEK